MAKFTIQLSTDHKAFSEGERDTELARILREIADKIEFSMVPQGSSQTIRDSNGNDIGRWKLHNDE